MVSRRGIISKICATMIGGGFLSQSVSAEERTTSVTVENDAPGDVDVVPNAPDLGGVSGIDAGVQIDIGTDGTGLHPEGRTVFEDVIEVSNVFSTIEVTFGIVDDGAGVGSNEVLDLKYNGESAVVDSPDNISDDGVTLGGGETATLTLEIDYLNNPEGGDIDGTVAITTASEEDPIFCFITTATADSPETLDSLRRFRDESMASTALGRGLTGLYYRISPPVAETLSRHPESRTVRVVRWLVTRCARLSDAQEQTESRTKSALLGVVLTALYILGVIVGGGGHLWLRLTEQI